MKLVKFKTFAVIALALLLVLGINSSVSAQGHSGGNHGGNSGGGGTGRGGGNSSGDRGVSTSSDNSNGRSDRGREIGSEHSDGRSEDGIDHARNSHNSMPSDNELNRYRGIARKLNTTPENLRSQYEAALANNPDLKFGQFVAANMIADNLSSRNSNITASAILSGLQSGKSIGQTLQDLGLSSSEAKDIEKSSKRAMKDAKKHN